MMEIDNADDIHVIEWRIENFSSCALQKSEKLESPVCTAGNLYGTCWTISLYPKEKDDSDFLGCYIRRDAREKCGPHTMHVEFEFSLITFDGLQMHKKRGKEEFERNFSFGFPEFVTLERIFSNEEFLLHSDVLTLRCKLRRLGPKKKHISENIFTTKFPVERVFAHLNLDNFLDTSKQNPRVLDLKGTTNWLLSLKVSMNKEDREGAVESEKPEPSESFLHIVMTKKNVTCPLYVSCWIKLLNNKMDVAVDKKLSHLFRKIDSQEEWILPYFIDTNNMQSDCMEDGSLSLDFDFAICEQLPLSMQTADLTPLKRKEDPKETTLMKDLADLHRTGKFSDITLRAEGEMFSVHRSILAARSPGLEKIVGSSMNETSNGEKCVVEIADVDKKTLALLLKFIYTDTLPVEDVNDLSCLSLYSAAQKYQIPSLQVRCVKFLRNNLSFKAVFKVLVNAEKYDDSELKVISLDYLRLHYQFILLTPEWQAFSEANEELANQVMRLLTLKKQH
ncbi:TD and POZ domain-containing protein 3 [Argiope bruennichi]|uniref:TD and POZ domain-containing protein 3 n=1 Tax=Argiope bruennichi TaxID=94029 RepID=A0A8T0ER33_ARGBR|nr:TD and POZ domain-containing protein 3 [Argiope bruennichi]